MRPVSIETFIRTVYQYDDNPPSVATVRRRCPEIPGAFKDGRRWRIDLDVYFETMERRVRGLPDNAQELGFLQSLANQLQ